MPNYSFVWPDSWCYNGTVRGELSFCNSDALFLARKPSIPLCFVFIVSIYIKKGIKSDMNLYALELQQLDQ